MPKTTKNSFENMTDEQKEVTMAYVNFFIMHKSKEKGIEKISSNTLRDISSISIAITQVSDRLLQKSKEDKEYKHIIELLHQSKQEGKIVPELFDIYKMTKRNALEKCETELEKLKSIVLGEQYRNYLALQQSSESKKRKLSEKILEDALVNYRDTHSIKSYNHLDVGIYFLKSDIDFELTPSLLNIKSDTFDVIEYIAFLLYKPEQRLIFEYLDDKWNKFPLKWARYYMGIGSIKTLFDMFKDGDDLSQFFVDKYQAEGTKKLIEAIDDPITRTPIARQRLGFKEAISQALSCYEDRHFMSCVYTILPVIEGILWTYSRYLDEIGAAEIYVKGTNFSQVVNSNGKSLKNPTVRDLLRNSQFQRFFDKEFIEYFCNELYNQRNPVLHGREFDFGSLENSAKKLATLEYLLTNLRGLMEDQIIKQFEKLPKQDIEIMLDIFTKKNN